MLLYQSGAAVGDANISQHNISHSVSLGSHHTNESISATQMPVGDARSTPIVVDTRLPMWWQVLSHEHRHERLQEAHKAVDMLWFVHGLSFNLIGSPLFLDAVKKIQAAPGYIPCCRQTLATTHLAARDADANLFKERRLAHGIRYGFLVTSDGWRNKKRRSYHNFILVAPNGPIFLHLKDATGEAGTAKAITAEFTEVFKGLDDTVYNRIVIGCTDTPSANVSAWKSLEKAHPKQLWIGCMAHELSLLFKDWVRKVPTVKDLYRRLKNITVWIRNHGDILILFEAKVKVAYPLERRKWNIKPYMPGDTRMATMYKMADRALKIKDILLALVTDPRYKKAAQEAVAGYNASTKPENRIPKASNGMFIDQVADDIMGSRTTLWALTESFIAASKTSLYFHRLVDSNLPTLGKVYYTSALINKQLKMLARSSSLAEEMCAFYEKRWARWHKDVHVLAYAVDPSFQSHKLSANEKVAVKRVLMRLRPESFANVLIQLNSFKSDVDKFAPQEWSAVDTNHAYLWWETMGTMFPDLQSVAVDILSKQCSASSCEFNWSAVSAVERKGRSALHCETTNQSVNVAAMYHLERQTLGTGVHMCLPKLADVVDVIVEEAEDTAPVGHSLIPENASNSCQQIHEQQEEEDEEDELTAAERRQLAEAQKMLYADWSTRDTLLDD